MHPPLKAFLEKLQSRLPGVLREFWQQDTRLSHFLVIALVVLGAVLNIFLKHGWTAWPFVFGVALMVMVNEAVDRNSESLPPMRAYGLLFGGLAIWVVGAIIFSVVNPVIFIAGVIATVYWATRAYLRQREREKLIARRREDRECIHCGQPIDPGYAYCTNCGLEPDPEGARHDRITNVIRTGRNVGRARQAMAPPSLASVAAKKEQALLARRQSRLRRKR